MTLTTRTPVESRATDDEVVQSWLETDLDAWTRRMVARHFDPPTGSPYWLRRAAELDFDPRDLTRYDQLTAFGPFPVVPHRTWLQATPTGPHLIGNGVWETTELHDGRTYAIEMDPRWVKRLVRAGRLADAREYTTHLLEPLSGTQLGADMYRNFTAAMDDGIRGRSYGNRFRERGGSPRGTERRTDAVYPEFPPGDDGGRPQGRPTQSNRIRKNGQVRLTVLHDDLFLSNIPERDQALRYDPKGKWPSDGVANVTPIQATSSAPEGLY